MQVLYCERAASAVPAHPRFGGVLRFARRLDWHNAGQIDHIVRDRLWKIIVTMQLETAEEASQFERYLKTGSGRAFAKRHLPSVRQRVKSDVARRQADQYPLNSSNWMSASLTSAAVSIWRMAVTIAGGPAR